MPLSNAINQASSTTQRVHNAIAGASARTGVNFDFLVKQAKVESGLNPEARARTSSATGLYQFTKQTWFGTIKEHGANHDLGWAAEAITRGDNGQYRIADPAMRARILDLRTQPEAAAAMAAELASDNHDFLNGKLGRAPEAVDLYLAHFLGEAGAARFLEAYDANPESAAAGLFPAAANANRAIFYRGDGAPRSFAEIRASFAAKLGGAGAPLPATYNTSSYAFGTPPAAIPKLTSGRSEPDPLTLRTIDPMPQRLSLEFARAAYQRLATLGGAS
jgi:hypothetical protein